MKITCKATVTSPYWLSNQFLAQPFYLKALIKNSMYIFVQGIPIFFRRENVRDFLHVKRMDKKKKMLSSTIFQKEKSLLGTQGHTAISGRGNM